MNKLIELAKIDVVF
uniref:Uncharacterized protein n=1 Tax=Anguilla anguilla TaxID=7936 RepID=A0A0E9VBH3_ANGAN